MGSALLIQTAYTWSKPALSRRCALRVRDSHDSRAPTPPTCGIRLGLHFPSCTQGVAYIQISWAGRHKSKPLRFQRSPNMDIDSLTDQITVEGREFRLSSCPSRIGADNLDFGSSGLVRWWHRPVKWEGVPYRRRCFLLRKLLAAVLATGASAQHVPKIWDARELATWATPVAGLNATPRFMSEAEYYRLPVDNLRTYPVYHPDREPKGYAAWLKQQRALPLIEPGGMRSEQDWIAAGQRVFDELDTLLARTSDPRALEYVRDRDALRREGELVSKDGTLPGFRWVINTKGVLQLTITECGGCHLRVMPDGTLLRGAQGNLTPGALRRTRSASSYFGQWARTASRYLRASSISSLSPFRGCRTTSMPGCIADE